MGGFLTTCKQRKPSYIPHGRVRHDTQLEALSSTDAILYKNPKTKQSQSYYHRSQHDFDIEESGPEKFNTKLSTHYLSRIWTKKLSPYTKEVIELSDRSSSESSGYSLVFNKEDPPPEPSPDYDFDDQHENVISFNQQALHVKPTEDPPPEPSPDCDFDDQHKHVISFNQQFVNGECTVSAL